jgi:hypothetical protein
LVYALFKNGKIFRYGESNDPARRLLEHIAEHGPLTMKVLPGGPYPKPVAFDIQVGYIKRFFEYWDRMPPGNARFS